MLEVVASHGLCGSRITRDSASRLCKVESHVSVPSQTKFVLMRARALRPLLLAMQGAANTPGPSQLSGAPLAQALGAKAGSSEGRNGASKWLRGDYGSSAVVNVG